MTNRKLRPRPDTLHNQHRGQDAGSYTLHVFLGVCLIGTGPTALAAGSSGLADGRWKPQGPAPISLAQVDVPPTDEASGAINGVAAHPTNPDILYIGSVNGGIWRTNNATDPSPRWKFQTPDFESQSVSEIEFDPTDPRSNTLVAGYGATSSFGNLAGELPGLALTRDGGRRWRIIGQDELSGATITGVASRGRVILAAARSTRVFDFPLPLQAVDGIWRSTNRGRAFHKISGSGAGLPAGAALDLVGDPNHPNVLYAAIVFGDPDKNGIYKTIDTGAHWTKVSDSALDAAINATPPGPANLELAVGREDNIFVSVVGSFNETAFTGALTALFRSGDGGSTWTSLDLPSTQEQLASFGLHPGFQGAVHNSIGADPSDPNIVYLGGDRQPAFTEPEFTSPFFPNSIGAITFAARLFRCDASKPSGRQCVHLTDCTAGSTSPTCSQPQVTPLEGGGTENDSAPHADSRHITFDANGSLIQVDDGGVYRLNQPATNRGSWTSVNGDLSVNEQHSQAFDVVARVNFVGTQDNGTPYQLTPDRTDDWVLFIGGDGGDVAFDASGFPATGLGVSTRFTSAQFLGSFNRSFWDSSNASLGFTILPLTPLDGTPGPRATAQFYTPIATNGGADGRLVLGASDGIYESLDGGDTVRRVAPVQALGTGRDPIAYGTLDNPDILYVGGGAAGGDVFDEVYVRTGPAAANAPLVESTTFPGKGSGLGIRAIVVNPTDSNEAFVVNGDDVFRTTDAGTTWSTITDRLPRRAARPFRSLLFIPDGSNGNGRRAVKGRLILGAANGAFVTEIRQRNRRPRWRTFGFGLPSTQVFELQYDESDRTVYAGTISNGAFKIRLRN